MNLLNIRKNDHKKRTSVAAVEIKPNDTGGVPSIMLSLPARSVVKEIYTVTESTTNIGVCNIASVDSTGTADALIDIDTTPAAVGVTANLLAAPVMTTTGMLLSFDSVGAHTTGVVQVVVVYDEYTLCTGTLTPVNISDVVAANLPVAS